MNSRRLMGPSAGGFAAYHTAVGNAALCITAKLIIEWQSWVIRVDLASGASPLVSRFQTYQAGCLSDLLCQQRSSSSSRNETLWNIGVASLQLGTRNFDDPRPFIGFSVDELGKLGGRCCICL